MIRNFCIAERAETNSSPQLTNCFSWAFSIESRLPWRLNFSSPQNPVNVPSKAQWIQPSQRANKNQSPCQWRHRCHGYPATTVHGQGMAGQDKRILRGKLKSKWKWLKVAEIMYLYVFVLCRTWENQCDLVERSPKRRQTSSVKTGVNSATFVWCKSSLSWCFLISSRTLDSALSKSTQNVGQGPLAEGTDTYHVPWLAFCGNHGQMTTWWTHNGPASPALDASLCAKIHLCACISILHIAIHCIWCKM